MTARKMPIGVQDFEKLITNNYVYVDKTAIAYNLVKNSTVVFLSRPRRFGKSLFLSTLKQYFLGNKEIFKGLAIEKLEEEEPTAFDGVAWAKHEVIHLDFGAKELEQIPTLKEQIDNQLRKYEKKYNILVDKKYETCYEARFSEIIVTAEKIAGRKVVVLVDAYDKPFERVRNDEKLFKEYYATIDAFYGVLKSEDAHLRFSMIVGEGKFAHDGLIYSGMNNLEDISMYGKYSGICGFSEEELKDFFKSEIEALAQKNKMTESECFAELKKRYDGYHFTFDSESIYNPFSLIQTFNSLNFGNDWFQTSTPTFLIEEIRRKNFNLQKIIDGVDVESHRLSVYSPSDTSLIPTLMQSGYLTIKGYDKEFDIYHLELPNEEVKYGFLNFLSPDFLGRHDTDSAFDVENFVNDVESGNVDSFMTRLKSVIASLPYPTDTNGREVEMLEYNFQVAVYLTFTLMGQFTQCEVHSIKGRADAVVETADAVYIFEFKTNDTAQNAIAQIEETGYAEKYAASGKKIVKIGASFSTEKRELTEWVCL